MEFALLRWQQTTDAISRYVRDQAQYQESPTAFRDLLERDQDARRQYTIALLHLRWPVPEGLLDDIPREFWPRGYEAYSQLPSRNA